MRKLPLLLLVIFLFNFLLIDQLFAQDNSKSDGNNKIKILLLNNNEHKYELSRYAQYYEDVKGEMSFDEINSPEFDNKFINSNVDTLNFGFKSSTYWIKLKFNNKRAKSTKWFFEIAYAHLDNIDFYYPDSSGKYIKKYASDHLKFKEREILYRNFVFSVDLPYESVTTLYLKIKTESSIQLPIFLWEPSSFSEKLNKEQYGLGLYYGIMLVMILYNLFLFFGIKDKAYLFYVIFITVYLTGQMSLDGFAFEYLWSNFPIIWNKSVLVSLFCTNIAMCLFNISFLKTHENSTILHYIFIGIIVISAFLAIASTFAIPYSKGVKIYALTAVLTPFVSLIAGIITLKRGFISARYYVLALTIFIFGIMALAMRNLGLIPNIFLTTYGTQLGSSCMVVLMSLGLADRINTMRKERFLAQRKLVEQLKENDRLKDEMNKELELKVQERTEELQSAMQELQAINEQLVETRDALWGEMQVAKKIQLSLVPKEPKISGYDIAAFMKPADEVGGDYYDIINTGDINWIVIGDVSGHGVPAGLIMMMVQTAIHVVLSQNIDMNPAKVLSIINKTVSDNIEKLSSGKYMTITVLAAYNDNKFYFSGLHQDIMVYRAESKSVELIETDGMWIGLVDDITEFMEVDSFEIKKNDSILLFTDGITESWGKESMDEGSESMFGGEKLGDIFRSLGEKSAKDIEHGILEKLQDYVADDDITFVVIKKL